VEAALRRSDVEHGARLLFARELAAGALTDAAVAEAAALPAVRAAVAPRRVPSRPERLWQLVRRKRGRLGWDAVAAPAEAARRAVLGDAAPGPPRFLVRVDEFPHVGAWDEHGRYGSEAFRRFHAILTEAGVPYLIAVPTRVSRAPLDPRDPETRPLSDGERARLHDLVRDGAALALHGRDHGTRDPHPRRHSELCGLDGAATAALLDTALGELAEAGLPRPDAFVPPYNRFDAAQYAPLAVRFPLVCGGPESIGLLGFQPPQWRDGAHYLPSYAPLYGRARAVLPAAQALLAQQRAQWAPITLHWGWELDDGWENLERLARALAPHAAPWEELLAPVRAERAAAG
jgi:peptidoglycan/xylan/chitin deacetylase (PgdA/CDA1 family)